MDSDSSSTQNVDHYITVGTCVDKCRKIAAAGTVIHPDLGQILPELRQIWDISEANLAFPDLANSSFGPDLTVFHIVKAGGMRITQHKGSKDEKESKPSKEKEQLEPEAGSLKVSTSPPKSLTISGAPVRGNADFPTEAVQSFHDKPVPTHDPRPAHSTKPSVIHQPRK
uniref:Death-associated protein 1 n=1 Tax=Timema shepardi TaxID=629360 RepID=A0A7R9AWX2_TIMSH|nr:unnamed protein product [Timema shepardi]